MIAAAAGTPGFALAARLAALPRAFSCRLPCGNGWRLGFTARRPAAARAAFGERDALPDQSFDRHNGLLVERSDEGNRGAGASGATGAADAVDIVIGMMWNVEIEHVAGGGNVEAAGGHIGCYQQRNFTFAELVECGGARRLIHIAVQGADD